MIWLSFLVSICSGVRAERGYVSQLRDMMEAADTNGDHMISFEEYAAAYGSKPWLRAQVVNSASWSFSHTFPG